METTKTLLPQNMKVQSSFTQSSINRPFHQTSEINLKSIFNPNEFSFIKQTSLKYSYPDLDFEDQNEFVLSSQHSHSQILGEDRLFVVLSLNKGCSEQWDISQEKMLSYSQVSVNQTTRLVQVAQDPQQFDQASKDHADAIHHENVTTTSKDGQNTIFNMNAPKFSTKNITKNMGKLLIKWIWANGQWLRGKLQCSQNIWEKFIIELKEWKKENNITRRFLTSRWHGEGESCRMFRIMSTHFFRSECWGSIVESNIENKWIHSGKISKFLEAVRNPSALDSLN